MPQANDKPAPMDGQGASLPSVADATSPIPKTRTRPVLCEDVDEVLVFSDISAKNGKSDQENSTAKK